MQRYKLNFSCPKCGDDKAFTTYHKTDFVESPCYHKGEHIHRKCSRCGYFWVELCLDATPEQAIEALPKGSVIASSTDSRGYVEST
jgi:hypothetical protein